MNRSVAKQSSHINLKLLVGLNSRTRFDVNAIAGWLIPSPTLLEIAK